MLGLLVAVSIWAQASIWQAYDASIWQKMGSQKLLLIKVERDGCRYCAYMDREVFSDSEVQKVLDRHFELVNVNISHERMPLQLDGERTPGFYVVDHQGKVIKQLLGAWTKEDFMDIITHLQKEQQ